MELIGNIRTKENKTSTKGKPYFTLMVNGMMVYDFNNLSEGFGASDNVSIVYETQGKFNHLKSIEKSGQPSTPTVSNVTVDSEYVNPAFFGMVMNQAVTLTAAQITPSEDVKMSWIIGATREYFNELWKLATELKKEKGVV